MILFHTSAWGFFFIIDKLSKFVPKMLIEIPIRRDFYLKLLKFSANMMDVLRLSTKIRRGILTVFNSLEMRK